ncbi:MAG: DUF4349 domain-containing protein [Lachnospiraceae bacterium]|nr:DUF4349 domain-containing protein [Lachnospiraceae bacterium]
MKKNRVGILGIFAAVVMLAGCGEMNGAATKAESSRASYAAGDNADYMVEEAYDMADYDMEAPMADEGFANGSAEYAEPGEAPDVTENGQNSTRKLIRNVSMNIETKGFDELLQHLEQRTKDLGGYIESSYSYYGSRYSGQGRNRSASMRIRIPAAKLDEYINDVSGIANVISRNENVSDVTLSYVDMESHRNALRAEESQLMVMMEKAETIEDLITIESRLSDIRYQIESMESQLRTYDNLVDYATLQLEVTEVEDLTPVVEQSAWEKMGSGFMNSLSSIGRGLKNFGIGFVMNLPYILLWGVIILVCFLVIRSIVRKQRRKNRQRQSIQMMQMQYAMAGAQSGMAGMNTGTVQQDLSVNKAEPVAAGEVKQEENPAEGEGVKNGEKPDAKEKSSEGIKKEEKAAAGEVKKEETPESKEKKKK